MAGRWLQLLYVRNAGAVVTGSHTDAIPLAGAYDGTLGVIGAIAALKALRAAGFRPERPIDALMFTSKEPTRFGLGCIGRQATPPLLTKHSRAHLSDIPASPRSSAQQSYLQQSPGSP